MAITPKHVVDNYVINIYPPQISCVRQLIKPNMQNVLPSVSIILCSTMLCEKLICSLLLLVFYIKYLIFPGKLQSKGTEISNG